MREQFRQILVERETHKAARSALFDPGHPFSEAYEAARNAACERVNGPAPAKSRKRKLTKACGVCDTCSRVLAQWQVASHLVWGTYDSQVKHAEERLCQLCEAGLRPQAGELEVAIATCDAGHWHTQGFGANKYAKGDAEMRADRARHYGIPVEVKLVSEQVVRSAYPVNSSSTYQKFEVVAKLAELLDQEILAHSRPPTLVEQVRMCWKRGVNPRVYDPWLPHGFEEKHGLDFFGGQKGASNAQG